MNLIGISCLELSYDLLIYIFALYIFLHFVCLINCDDERFSIHFSILFFAASTHYNFCTKPFEFVYNFVHTQARAHDNSEQDVEE